MEITLDLQQGEDTLLELPLFENNLAFDTSLATNIIASFLVNKVSYAKFSLQAQVGYGVLSLKAGAGNEHIVILQITREISKNFPVGLVSIPVLVEIPDVTLGSKRVEFIFDGGSSNKAIVTQGYLKDETF